MSQPPARILTARHYQVIGGMALVTMFFVQLQQNMDVKVNMLVLFLGACTLLFRVRLSPLYVFLAMLGGHLLEQSHLHPFFKRDLRSLGFLTVTDLVLCMATLLYLVTQYRLQSLWFHVVPPDARERAPRKEETRAEENTELGAALPQARTERTLSADEFFLLIIASPFYAVAAELLAFFLQRSWTNVDLEPNWKQFLAVSWLLLVVIFVSAHFFRYWKSWQMDAMTARLLLQDTLWQETRSEQRHINRWIVWRKLKTEEETH